MKDTVTFVSFSISEIQEGEEKTPQHYTFLCQMKSLYVNPELVYFIVCTDRLGPRSYRLNVGERTYVRNRRQLIRTREPIPCDPDMTGGAGETVMERRPEAESSQAQQEPDGGLEQQRPEDWETEQPALPRTPQPRRSQRNRKPPEWITSYVPY